MRYLRSFLVWLWVFTVAMMLGGRPGVNAADPEHEFYLAVRVEGEFEEVVKNIEKAIRLQNFFVAGTTDLDEGIIKRKGAQGLRDAGFLHYKIIGFCNLTLAEKALRLNPDIGVFMPCRFAVYQPVGSSQVVIATMRPTYMARVFNDPAVKVIAEEVERAVRKILEEAEGF